MKAQCLVLALLVTWAHSSVCYRKCGEIELEASDPEKLYPTNLCSKFMKRLTKSNGIQGELFEIHQPIPFRIFLNILVYLNRIE